MLPPTLSTRRIPHGGVACKNGELHVHWMQGMRNEQSSKYACCDSLDYPVRVGLKMMTSKSILIN